MRSLLALKELIVCLWACGWLAGVFTVCFCVVPVVFPGVVPQSLFVCASLRSCGFPLHRCAKSTSLPVAVFPHVAWEESLVFPARIDDLAADAKVRRK